MENSSEINHPPQLAANEDTIGILKYHPPVVVLTSKSSKQFSFQQRTFDVRPPKKLRLNEFWVGFKLSLGDNFMVVACHHIHILKTFTSTEGKLKKKIFHFLY